eukprot:tig00020560_g11077.t1
MAVSAATRGAQRCGLTFCVVQRRAQNLSSPFINAPYDPLPDGSGFRYSLLTTRQYKLRLVARDPEACAAWQGATLRVSLAFADTGEVVLTAAGRPDRYGKRRKSLTGGDRAAGEPGAPMLSDPSAPPLLAYHDLISQDPRATGQGPPPSRGPIPCREVLLRIGPNGETIGTFGLLASSFRHDRRSFALRIAVDKNTGGPPRFVDLEERLVVSTLARKPRGRSDSVAAASEIDDSASAAGEEEDEDEDEDEDRVGRPASVCSSAAGGGGGKRGRRPSVQPVHSKQEPAPPPAFPPPPPLLSAPTFGPALSFGVGAPGGVSSEDASPNTSEGDFEGALDRLCLEDRAAAPDPDAIIDLEDFEKAPYHATRPGRFSKIFHEMELQLGRIVYTCEPDDQAEPLPLSVPKPAPAWIPVPIVQLDPSPLSAAAFLRPPNAEADAVLSRLQAAYRSPDALSTPHGLAALASALSDPCLLGTELFNSFEGHFRVQAMLYRLEEAGQRSVVDSVLEGHRSRLLALQHSADPEETALAAMGIMEFVTAVTTWMGPVPADLLPMRPEHAAELLDKAGELLTGHEDAAALACCDLLYRRAMHAFQTGQDARALELCYEGWARVIRHRLYPCRVEARLVKSIENRVYWFEAGDEDLVDRAVNLQILSVAQSMRGNYAGIAPFFDGAVDTLEDLATRSNAVKGLLAWTLFLKAVGSLHIHLFATVMRSWKRAFRLLQEACSGPGDVFWDVACLLRDHCMRIGRGNEFHSPQTLARLFRLMLMIMKLSDPRNATPLRAHTLAVYGELHQRTGAHAKAAECFAESLGLLQGRWPLLFTDTHPRVVRLRSLLEASRSAAAGGATGEGSPGGYRAPPRPASKPKGGFFSRLLHG